jgi:hypothetical protein
MQPFFSRFGDVIGLEQVWLLSIKKKSNKVTVLKQISRLNLKLLSFFGGGDSVWGRILNKIEILLDKWTILRGYWHN